MKHLYLLLLAILAISCTVQHEEAAPLSMVDRYLGHQLDESHQHPDVAPAKVIEWPDGSRRVERFLNRMRHDNQGPAVVNIDAQGDTTYRACFECDKPVPCP